MKRLFSILATAGLFVAVTNTVSAKSCASSSYFARCGSSQRKKDLLQVLRSNLYRVVPRFMGNRSFMFKFLVGGSSESKGLFLKILRLPHNKTKATSRDALASGGIEAAKEVLEIQKVPVLLSISRLERAERQYRIC